MSILENLRKNLSPEIFSAVQDALGDDFDDDMVPRSRLNKVIKQRNEARKALRDYQNDSDDDGYTEEHRDSGSGNSKQQTSSFTQEDIDAAVLAERAKNNSTIVAMQKRYAVTEKLREANFVDPDIVINAGLVNLDKIKLSENGGITEGLDDQISSLTESKPYLIKVSGNGQRGTGKVGGSEEFGSVTSRDEFLKLPTDKQIEFKNTNPELFKSFLKG